MPKPTLLLFTDNFPYGFGEPFLETEISVLAIHFDRVFVIPHRRSGIARTLPTTENITLIDDLWQTYHALTSSRLQHMSVPLTEAHFYGELIRHPAMLKSGKMLKSMLTFFTQVRAIRLWISRFLEDNHIDPQTTLIYTYWMNGITFGVTSLLQQTENWRVISRVHGYDLYHHRHTGHYMPLWQANITALDKIFVISQHGRDYLHNHARRNDHVHLSYLGTIDHNQRNVLSTDGVFRVVSCSSLSAVKRIDRLIDGLAHFATQHPKRIIEWTHLGSGVLEEPLKSQAQAILPNNASYHFKGQLSNQEIYTFYATHPVDVFALVSESEGLSVATMEAQSFGIPLIATDVGGMSEIVNDRTGRLLPAQPTTKDIADALVFISDHTSIEELRDNSREYWEKNFNAVANYDAFVKELLSTMIK